MKNDPVERERLLASAAAGELAADDRRLRELLEQNPELREELQDLQEIAGRLESSGKLSREILAEAARRADAPGSERLESTLRAELQRRADDSGRETIVPQRSASSRRSWLVAAGALAAAAGLLFLFTYLRRPDAPGGNDLELGGLRITELTPSGRVDQLREFTWRCALPSDGFFELQIDDARREFAGEASLLERVPGLIEPRWTPGAERVEGWPARIRWRVRALDASRAEIGRSSWVEVER